MIINGQVPWAVQEVLVHPGVNDLAIAVDHLQRALADRCNGPIGRRDIADHHETTTNGAECRAESSDWAHKESNRSAGRRQRPARPQLHDRRARTLTIGAVVEVADQHVSSGQGPAGRKAVMDECDAVGIYIAICGDGRGIHRAWKEPRVGSHSDALAKPAGKCGHGHDKPRRMNSYGCGFHHLLLLYLFDTYGKYRGPDKRFF